MRRIWVAAAVSLLVVVGVSWYWLAAEDAVDFNTQVKPILNKKCIACHGGVKREADYSLLFPQDALAKAESGQFAIVPGEPEHSELLKRINSHDPEYRMPYKKDPLTEEEIKTLTDWIRQGAKWGDHWAYQPIKEVEIPGAQQWGESTIDRFIFEKLTDHDLTPSPEAPKEKLLRRVSLDLIGMPAPESLRKKYLADNDPRAFESLVDSLLLSKRFGERWASMWLDLARYSDTKGYERDYIRSIWRYRDWVIDAFNRDLPYDSFLIQQIAGDLLPSPSDAQYLATAFHRNTMTNDEGGTDNEEFRTAAVIDRVNTTWETLMGTTFACVQCHSHPYDPFRHEDYYKFMAFFNNTRDEDTYDDYPTLRHFNTESLQKLDRIEKWIAGKVSPQKASEIYRFVRTWQPTINSIQSDQFVNSALTDTKWLIFRNHGKARLPRVSFVKSNRLIYRFAGFVDGGVWTIRRDSHNGPEIARIRVPNTKGNWTIAEVPIAPTDGVHDLFFSYEAPTLTKAEDSGMIFDWFYFTDTSIPWDEQSMVYKKDFWELLTAEVESTPIMMENPEGMRRETRIFERGNWLVKGDRVEPAIPASLPPMDEAAPKNRLGLAQWMTNPSNPLVSRTIVNRIWEQLFGLGLAETLEDLGTQGIPPTHPELLDYLSLRLMNDHHWSIKTLIKEIVMSSTYRQDSHVTPEHLAKDRANKFYARAPRVRLTAEQIRDQALAISGLLSTRMYGPGSMPFQPDGIWRSPYNGQSWKQSQGSDQYRRAVYTYWKRTAPYPSMITFDGSAREVCQARRIRTNTPLQALVTLNDSVYVEAASHLADRMLQAASDRAAQISFGYVAALGHEPSAAELQVLTKLFDKIAGGEIQPASNHAGKQKKAMMLVASAIMNLDEFITKN